MARHHPEPAADRRITKGDKKNLPLCSVILTIENGKNDGVGGAGGGWRTIYKARKTISADEHTYPTHSPSGMSSFPQDRTNSRGGSGRLEVISSHSILLDGELKNPFRTHSTVNKTYWPRVLRNPTIKAVVDHSMTRDDRDV